MFVIKDYNKFSSEVLTKETINPLILTEKYVQIIEESIL